MAGRFRMAGYPEVIQRLRRKRQAYCRVARDTLRTAIVHRSTVLETAPCVQKEMAGVGAMSPAPELDCDIQMSGLLLWLAVLLCVETCLNGFSGLWV
jgi:hypothetical protein